MSSPAADVLTAPYTLQYKYRRSLGPILSAFVTGLRDGRIAFDLPAAEVTRAQLAHLYAQHEDEWLGGGAADADAEAPPAPAPPAVMHCR